ncbi:4-oxalomesaconate tautomerase [Devosia sp. 919]|uniref:4-oxalomesaconate tautomerase n=1 Tax=Devosia sp. 919 TaxID=2726065 RepID=UPI001551D769|nr:4-oxalomesaconate tautomerase [Devosia sp. 919]
MSEPGTRVMWMRGGTSKGGFFLAEELPADIAARDALLLRIMGSPDSRQIDGMGGANPLTSKVAVVKRSVRPGVDVDYLFLQVSVDKAVVSDKQNCGNILAGVGPFAIERGLIPAQDGTTSVRIFMENTGQIAVSTVATPDGAVVYDGDARIDGVPGTAAAVPIFFEDTAGSSCGALLPTGNAVDRVLGVDVTLIDNGMPCVILDASDFGVTGTETPAELDANDTLRQRLEEIRLAVGPMMNLGDVRDATVPKMTLVSPARSCGVISTRSFIPHKCHDAIGVLAAVSVASACLLPEGPAQRIAAKTTGQERSLSVEHPTGEFTVVAQLDDAGSIAKAGVLRTARKLMDGWVY